MPSPITHLDFETRSTVDLRKAGLDVYAAHPSTEILCAAYAFDEGPVKIWCPLRQNEPAPLDLIEALTLGFELHAYNAGFELAMINAVCTRRYGWPSFDHRNARCVMAMSYAMGLPGSLAGCAAALGVTEQKDQAGGRVMLQYSQPRDTLPDGTPVWWNDPKRLEEIYEYCKTDVRVERAVEKRMLPLSPYEQKVWCLDYEINRRGCAVDVKSVRAAITLVEEEKARLNAEMREVTNNAVATCTAVQQIKDYLEFFGISDEGLDKATVGEHLAGKDLHPTARRVLELRSEAGKAATSKFTPMVESAGDDGRVRGCYQYSGANTRRFAGRRIQLHNLQRQKTKFEVIESMINDVAAGMSPEELALYYGPPMTMLGECTRSFLWAATPEQELLGADFSSIEARVLAWLAGQESTLEVFRNGKCAYRAAASSIFGVPAERVTDEQRQVGKVAVLALGYGGGVGAFQTMAKGYGVRMEPAYQYLMSVARPDQRIRAEATYKSNKGKYEEISKEEFLASDLTKILWREANPNIVDFWHELEDAACRAVLSPGTQVQVGWNLKYKKVGSFLWCQLPGGGVICYPYPEVREIETPWGEKKMGLTYMAEDGQSHKWMRFKTYGGSLGENITQAVSRDLLVDAMLRLDEEDFRIVLHTHDEAVIEQPKGEFPLSYMIEIMTTNPSWAATLPVAAAGFTSRRYRK